MRRRRLILAAGGIAAVPLLASAQSAAGLRRVGFAMSGSRDDPVTRGRVEALRRGLQGLGWIDGANVRFDTIWMSNATQARGLAVELVGRSPDVVLAYGTEALQAMHDATEVIPIVFVNITDPVAGGFVASLARPGGNITGFTAFEYAIAGKWLELLQEMAPRLSRVALLGDSRNHNYAGFMQTFQTTARARSIEPLAVPVREADDIGRALASLSGAPGGGLIISAATFSNVHRRLIVDLAAKHRLPAIYWARVFVADGGLISYGPNSIELHRGAAGYVDRILKGARPADLPVQEPTVYELVVNLKTANTLGLEPSANLLARVDEIIE